MTSVSNRWYRFGKHDLLVVKMERRGIISLGAFGARKEKRQYTCARENRCRVIPDEYHAQNGMLF